MPAMKIQSSYSATRTADELDPRQIDRIFLLGVAIASVASLILALLN